MAPPACCRVGGGRRRRFLLSPPKMVSRTGLAKWAALVGFGQVRLSSFFSILISFLFLLISVFDFN
jgi:hypothetical protein